MSEYKLKQRLQFIVFIICLLKKKTLNNVLTKNQNFLSWVHVHPLVALRKRGNIFVITCQFDESEARLYILKHIA